MVRLRGRQFMTKEGHAAWRRYAGAIGLTALATIIRWALTPLLGSVAPFTSFVMAVAITALYNGLGPALLTTFAGALIALFVWVLPAQPRLSTDRIITNVVVYLSLCVFVSVLIEMMRRTRQRAEENATALDGSRKLLSIRLGSIGDAVMATDVEGRVTFINPVA